MAGANYVLDKGYVYETAAGTEPFLFVKFGADDQKVAAVTLAADVPVGVVQEKLDAAKAATGKAAVDVRILGISRVKVGVGGVALGALVNNDAAGKAVAVGVAGTKAVGRALQAGVADDIVDVLLIPGGQVT